MTRFFPEKPRALAEAAVMDTTLPGAQEAPPVRDGPRAPLGTGHAGRPPPRPSPESHKHHLRSGAQRALEAGLGRGGGAAGPEEGAEQVPREDRRPGLTANAASAPCPPPLPRHPEAGDGARESRPQTRSSDKRCPRPRASANYRTSETKTVLFCSKDPSRFD